VESVDENELLLGFFLLGVLCLRSFEIGRENVIGYSDVLDVVSFLVK